MWALLKRPAGFIPILISGGFLTMLLIGLAQGTLVRRPDEDAGAHLFQILMPVQFLVMIWFAISWLPQKTKAALEVLALQCAGALAVLVIVYSKHL